MSARIHDDEMSNNLLATGALFSLLTTHRPPIGHEVVTDVTVVTNEGDATNVLECRFFFLKSRYRITVERIAEPDE